MKESNRKGIKLVSTIHRDLLKNITMKKRMTPTTGHSFSLSIIRSLATIVR